MRVIAGKAKRIQLNTIPGEATRPTTDRIKETLFNMIGPDMYDATFLDLFAGSGAIGIEALSRGAKRCVFVENNPQAVTVIKGNLVHTKLKDNAVILAKDVFLSLKMMENKDLFDFIFMDPPYNQGWEKKVLTALQHSTIIKDDTRIIVESSIETDFSYLGELGFEIEKDKTYKSNRHIFIKKT